MYGPEILLWISEVLSDPLFKDSEQILVYENCVSSLGKICFYKSYCKSVNENTWELFLNLLPLKYDAEEA